MELKDSTREEKSQTSGDDLRELIEHFGTNHKTVENLLKGGIERDDLYEVLELRDGLSESVKSPYTDKVVHDIVSAEALARAYKATGGDLDMLTRLVNITADYCGEHQLYPGLRTSMLKHTVDLFEDGDLDLSKD
jgi:hypothetical protein